MALPHAAALGACALVALAIPPVAGAATNNVFTVAGGAGTGFAGDGGLGTAAALDAPVAVAASADGGFVIADLEEHRVRRVAADATIGTVAGTGAPGFSGDGGPATAAALDVPEGVLETPDGGLL